MLDTFKVRPSERFAGKEAKPDFNLIQPTGGGWREMKMNLGMGRQPVIVLLVNPAFRLKLSPILFSATRCTPVHACCPELMRQFLLASPSHPGPQKCGR